MGWEATQGSQEIPRDGRQKRVYGENKTECIRQNMNGKGLVKKQAERNKSKCEDRAEQGRENMTRRATRRLPRMMRKDVESSNEECEASSKACCQYRVLSDVQKVVRPEIFHKLLDQDVSWPSWMIHSVNGPNTHTLRWHASKNLQSFLSHRGGWGRTWRAGVWPEPPISCCWVVHCITRSSRLMSMLVLQKAVISSRAQRTGLVFEQCIVKCHNDC